MKFKFCGGSDCPDWLISEITYLNKINAVKLRIISNKITNLIAETSNDSTKISNILEEIGFSKETSQIIIGVLYFIFKSSVKNKVDSTVLLKELSQLGLPQENAESICKVYKNNFNIMEKALIKSIFKENNIDLNNIDYKISYIIASKYNTFSKDLIKQIKQEDNLTFTTKNFSNITQLNINDFKFNISKEMLGKLINDLEKADKIVNSDKHN